MQLRGPQIPSPHLTNGKYHTNALKPSGDCLRETVPRYLIGGSDNTWFTTAKESLVAVEASAGDVIHAIAFHSSTTGGSGMTAQWFRLRDSAGLDLAFTADDGSLAWAGNTQKKSYISRTVTDAVATSGSAVVTSATAAFTASDVGRHVTFMGAGAAGAPLGGAVTTTTSVQNAGVTILSVDSATQVTLSANAGTSVASAGTLYIATPYTVTTTGQFYISGCVVGTVPKLCATTSAINSYVQMMSPPLSFRDDTHTGLTTPASAPGTSTFTATSFVISPYAYLASS